MVPVVDDGSQLNEGAHPGNGSSFSWRMKLTMVNGVHRGDGPNAAFELRDKASHS